MNRARHPICVACAFILCLATSAIVQAQSRSRRSDSRSDSRSQSNAPASTRPTTRQTYTDLFASLEEHNIFLRDRRSYRPNRSGSTTRSSQRSAEELLVVTGIVLEDADYHAYVEDLDSHVVTKLSPGQKIAHGTVGDCDIDAVEYIHDGKSLWLEIGSDFTGKRSFALSVASSSYNTPIATTGPSTIPADLAGLNINDPNLTTEQRMRLRRLQERR